MFLEKNFEKKMEEFRKRKKRKGERDREKNSQMQTCSDTNLERERIWWELRHSLKSIIDYVIYSYYKRVQLLTVWAGITNS